MDYTVPDYYGYLNWHDLYSPVGIYNFMQEFIAENDINEYPDIKTYYNMLCDIAFRDDPDMIVVDYVINKLRNRLIQYGFAHSTYTMKVNLKNKNLYFYWKQDIERKE